MYILGVPQTSRLVSLCDDGLNLMLTSHSSCGYDTTNMDLSEKTTGEEPSICGSLMATNVIQDSLDRARHTLLTFGVWLYYGFLKCDF